jgi:multiple sugar transport system permease protein
MAVRISIPTPAGAWSRLHGFFHKNAVREALLAYLLLVPIVFLILALVAYPFISAIYLSLTEKMVGYPPIFVGLKNYLELFSSAQYRKVVQNSFIFTFGAIGIKLGLGMAMALALQRAVGASQMFRGLLLIPWVIPTVVTALTWWWLFDLLRGLINTFLLDIGLLSSGIHWLGNPALAMLSVIIANVWRGFPFFGVSFLAAMQTIPQDLYEAAEVDGASARQQFWHITLPSIRGVIIVVTLLSTIWTLNDFNIVYIMTRGGPGTSTHIFATYSYELGIQSQRWGLAVAASMYSVPLLALTIVLISRYLQSEEAE